MPELTCTGKECCHVCGSADYREAHFTAGRLLCLRCWREIETTRRKGPPSQQSFNLAHATQREGVARG
jgi:hypothetical protein